MRVMDERNRPSCSEEKILVKYASKETCTMNKNILTYRWNGFCDDFIWLVWFPGKNGPGQFMFGGGQELPICFCPFPMILFVYRLDS